MGSTLLVVLFKMLNSSLNWNVKKILMTVHRVFKELVSRRADYEKVAAATEKDYPLHFCATPWLENADVARKASNIWSKVVVIT